MKVLYSRHWAMPSPWTFTIPPIAKLISRYVGDGFGWVDPFAGENSPAEITNDLNPLRPTKYHLHAIGYGMSLEDTQFFPNNVKDIIAHKIETNGIAICCGWGSGGFGKNLGFQMLEILLVPHGGHRHDTIVTVERKFQSSIF